jgi:hypothetical protein
MGIIDHKWAGRALFFICFSLITIPKAFTAGHKSFFEIGGGLVSFALHREAGIDRTLAGMGTFALMGKHFGLEALIVTDLKGASFGGSLVFCTDSGAPVSAFLSCGACTSALLLGTGLRVKVSKNLFVTGKVHCWVTYEGGLSLTLGAVYRL